MALLTPRPFALAVATATVGLALTACSPSGEGDSTAKMESASTTAAASSTAAMMSKSHAASATSSAMAAESGTVTIMAEHADHVHEGDILDVTVTGLDPAAGYYAAICASDTPAGGMPNCTGVLTDPMTAAWIKADDTGTVKLAADGTATFALTATHKGDAVDCATDSCVLKVFGDHSNGFVDVAELPVEFHIH